MGSANLMIIPHLIFEITNSCNLNCGFCYNKNRRANTHISPELFKKALKKYRPLFLQLTGGEITTHPNLKEILEIGKKNSIKMQISTNGLELNKIIKNIVDYINKPIINISLDAANEDHDIIRDSKGLFNKIIAVIKENKRYNIPFTFNATIFSENIIPSLPDGNIKHVSNLIALAEEIKVPINFQPYAPADKGLRKKLGLILLKSDSPYILNTLSYRKTLIDSHNGECKVSWINKSLDIHGKELPTNKDNCYFCKECSKCYYSCVWEPSLLNSHYFLMSVLSFLFRNNLSQFLRKCILQKYD